MIFMHYRINRGDSQINHVISQYYEHISLETEYDKSIDITLWGNKNGLNTYLCENVIIICVSEKLVLIQLQ